MDTATQAHPWTHRKVDGWWCVYDSRRRLLAKFIREGDALTFIDMAHRGVHPRHCSGCSASLTAAGAGGA